MTLPEQPGAIAFAEKLLELLDEGRYTATYKFAVLLALMDACLEHTERSGLPRNVITTRQLADKIVELYWPQSVPFAGLLPATILKQNTVGQAEIISAIARFRTTHGSDPSVPRWECRFAAPQAYERLTRRVEWKLIEMPLPRLQTASRSHRPFIYEINWEQRVDRREVARYQAGQPSGFDNRVMLKPGVGEYFLMLNGLLRPLIQRQWAAMVAQLNRMTESQLDMFLFGADHLHRWTRRFDKDSRMSGQLTELAQHSTWDRQPCRSLNVARAIYIRLPADAKLWLRTREFVAPDQATIGAALDVSCG